ncbi:MAG: tyrosine-type recombinase/integrase [Anaerolineales bacterium]|nr:tyrosine-type recombinase/integrase [Anaerolineales bacterium]
MQAVLDSQMVSVRFYRASGHQPALRPPVISSALDEDIAEFLFDREARGLSQGTLRFYRQKLALVQSYSRSVGISSTSELSTKAIREMLVQLQRNHNAGGVHAAYRAVRAFLLWWGDEAAPLGWRSPLARVAPPRVPIEPLEPVGAKEIHGLLADCRRGTFYGDRDRAVILTLLDTGCRASEFLAMNHGDLDLTQGQALIRRGKGAKPRMVFIEAKCRKSLAAYFRHLGKSGSDDPVWVTKAGDRLTYEALRDVLRRRARSAGIEPPTLHAFRRTFALTCLRNGMDIFSLQRLMGHADLTVLRRYLAQTDEDVKKAHRRFSPAQVLA